MSAGTTASAGGASRLASRARRARLLDAVLLAVLVGFCALFVVWPIACFVWQGLTPAADGSTFAIVLNEESDEDDEQ